MNKLFAYITYGGSEGIDLGFFTLHFYSLMWVVAFVLGWFIMSKIFKIDKTSKELLDPLFFYMFIGVIAGARLGEYLFYDPSAFIEKPLEVFLPVVKSPGSSAFFGLLKGYKFVGFMGLASHGAAIGTLLSLFLFSRKHLKDKHAFWIFDRMGIPVAIGGFFIRIGNFINSEIVGKPSDASWAVLFKKQSLSYGEIVPRHPAQLYEAFSYAILFLVMWFIYRKTNKKYQGGFLFGFFMMALWSIRFIIEFFKENQGVEWVAETLNINLDNGQVLSIPLIIFGLIILITSKNRIQNENN